MFRINDAEYDLIRTACEAAGSRSFSDFARTAVLSHAADSGNDRVKSDPITELQFRVRELEERVQTLMSSLLFRRAAAAGHLAGPSGNGVEEYS